MRGRLLRPWGEFNSGDYLDAKGSALAELQASGVFDVAAGEDSDAEFVSLGTDSAPVEEDDKGKGKKGTKA